MPRDIEAFKRYWQEYLQRPEVKERQRARSRRRIKTAPYKEYQKSYQKFYQKTSASWKQYAKNYQRNPKRLDYVRNYNQKPQVKLSNQFRARINHSLRGNKNGRRWEGLVGYTRQQLVDHLEQQFQPGMNWDNYGEWHIDHKIPISLWQFDKPEDSEFKQCWSRCNLQPLWSAENLSKGAYIE